WGVLLALILTGVAFYLPKSVSSRYSHTPVGLLLLVIGFCFFAFQSVLLAGGFKVKGYVPSTDMIEQLGIDQTSPEAFADELTSQYPMLEKYIRKITDKGEAVQKDFATVAELARFMRNKLLRTVNNYIWRRVGWIAGGLFLLGFYFVNSASKQNRGAAYIIEY
ncbi:MAG: hypothetical protein LBR08_11840, partial [Bacteroidales bacterium]|nr:hypothetical protein [Bacteroidales bacterium]